MLYHKPKVNIVICLTVACLAGRAETAGHVQGRGACGPAEEGAQTSGDPETERRYDGEEQTQHDTAPARDRLPSQTGNTHTQSTNTLKSQIGQSGY